MYPFDKEYSVTSSFADHLIPNPNYPGREKEPGTDFGTPYKTPIKAIWRTTLIDRYVNEFGTVYLVQVNPETNQRIDFIHSFVDVPIGSVVDEGTVVGRTDGVSDYPRRSSGAHVLVTYRSNWKSNSQGYEDVVPYFNSLANGNSSTPRVTGSYQIPNTYFETEFTPVFAGEGLAAVATRAGLSNPDTEATWIYLSQLNGFGNDWERFNASLRENQQVKVRNIEKQKAIIPITLIEKAVEKQNIQKEEVKVAVENHVDVVKNLIEDNKETIAQKQAEIAQKATENEKLMNYLGDFVQKAGGDYGLENLVFDIVKEEVKGKGIVEKWHAFVDSHTDLNIVRSLLKYDWPWIIFFIATFITLIAPFYQGTNTLVLGALGALVAIAGFILKFFSSNVELDRNKDGKIDLKDTYTYEEILKNK